ncbi:helix-turn-helix domain-containing protein [Ideonella sp.]|uniref:helix-turn-helix domain-containing protein n=1 Tax=Ideonella sp. TaxID=1929293 RepID=UPI003BB55445
METFSSQFGARLKLERKARGMSQDEAAALVGVSREHWGRCERGQGVFGGEVLAVLAAAGWNVHQVLTGASFGQSGTALPQPEQLLLEGFRNLDQRTRKRLLAFVITSELPESSPDVHVVQHAHAEGTTQIGKLTGGLKIGKK